MYRLLIADDEMIERAVLYKTLHKNLGDQCAIFQAENGREALRIYEEEKIQIAILDIEMPGINGIGAAEKIRETGTFERPAVQPEGIVWVFISGEAAVERGVFRPVRRGRVLGSPVFR